MFIHLYVTHGCSPPAAEESNSCDGNRLSHTKPKYLLSGPFQEKLDNLALYDLSQSWPGVFS